MAEETRRFEIASVLSRTTDTIGANPLLFGGLALILAGPPKAGLFWWQSVNVDIGTTTELSAFYSGIHWGPVLVGWLVSMICGAVLQASLTRATITHISGEVPDFRQCLMTGLMMILPMIGIEFLLALGVGLGLVLLVVPGIILWLCWSVVVPVYVQENVGVFEAFGRSVALTKGMRWRIFLTMLVALIVMWALNIPIGMVTAAFGTGGAPLAALLSGILGALGSMLLVTIQASIYVELRNAKDGVAPADLEEIFA